MVSIALILTFLIIALVYFLFRIRYDSSGRTFILKLICSLQNIPSIVLKSNAKLCKMVLDSSDVKGKGMEFFFALPGWSPIYNSESVDGDRWRKLLSIFRRIMHKLDYQERMGDITVKHCKRICEDYDNIDSMAIQILTVRVFFELLFKKEITLQDEKLFIAGTNEWRKHVAQKGESDKILKEKMVDRVIEILKESQFDIEGLKEEFNADKYELVSSFMQPFLISPIINFSDIFCELSIFLSKNKQYEEKLFEVKDMDKKLNENTFSIHLGIIYESIRLRHPFPILERDLTRDVTDGNITLHKGTHVYIELDSFVQSQDFKPENWQNIDYYKENSWILFATGPRMCAGKVIALNVMENMLKELVKGKKGNFEKLKMWENHAISGRVNDSTVNLKEVRHQVKTLFKTFKELTMKRMWK